MKGPLGEAFAVETGMVDNKKIKQKLLNKKPAATVVGAGAWPPPSCSKSHFLGSANKSAKKKKLVAFKIKNYQAAV